MMRMVISLSLFLLFVLLFISVVNAVEFNFTSPEEIPAEEEFSITITLNEESSDTYDVKAFVHHHTKEFSEIYDGTVWKSPFNYLKSVFPSQKEFRLISHYIGETNICVRLRSSQNPSSFSEKCKPIVVLTSQSPEEEEEQNNQEDEDTPRADTVQKAVQEQEAPGSNTFSQVYENEKIILNQKIQTSSSNEENLFISKKEKTRQWIIYSFLIFCIALLILFALRKL